MSLNPNLGPVTVTGDQIAILRHARDYKTNTKANRGAEEESDMDPLEALCKENPVDMESLKLCLMREQVCSAYCSQIFFLILFFSDRLQGAATGL